MRPVDMHDLVALHGNVHPLARREFDQGVAPDDLPLQRILLVLQRGADQETSLRQLLDDQQVKSSPRFHQWLTPEQFGQQFGPADSDLQAVTDWLALQGFQVTKVSAGRTVIEFSGTAGLARQVLGTEIHRFRVNGQDHWANISDPQIPAALAPVVAGFASLNNFPRKPMYHSLGTFSRSKATGEVQPLFSFPVSCGGGSGNCYYLALGPADFATIYNVAPLWSAGTDGTGQTIAVVGETNINPQDVADFRAMFGLPAKPPNILLNGPDPGITSTGEEGEADLDVQWSGAVAKGATIDFVLSESTETTPGIDLSALYIIDNNLAPIMSESYGACEAYLGVGGNQFYSTLWEQAAAQGITVLMASGDAGSAGCDSANAGETTALYGLGVSGLASTPFNVAVGGTDFAVNANNALTYWSLTNNSSQASAKSYIPESTWNDSCAASGSLAGCNILPSYTYFSEGYYLLAGGGGPSNCTNPSGVFPHVNCSGGYSKPSWQGMLGEPNARDIPDVSMFAGEGFHYSFYVTCQMDANSRNYGYPSSCDLNAPYADFQGGSGTSASVQVFAGIMAMVTQRYGRQGNANYVLYPMAGKSGASCNSSTASVTNSSCVFYDVTSGNDSVICLGGALSCSSSTSGQYGIMVSGGTAAYPATTGYDMATGLGSVNVANLVNNWTSNFTTTTTSLSLSTNPASNPITLTHGQPIDFTFSVKSGSGTPSGDVSLIAHAGSSPSGMTSIGPFTMTGGSVSGSTLMLPGGSYNVTAHYAGNNDATGSFAASDSAPGIPVTVGKENSLTELRLATPNAAGFPVYTVNTVPYGSVYILRMDVTNSSGQPCADPTTGLIAYPCPSGALTVSPAPTELSPPPGTVPGSYVLNSRGYAEDQPIQLPGGTYNFVASYAGDNGYTASKSSTLPVTITQAATTTTLMGVPALCVGGAVDFSLTIKTQSNGAAPTGNRQILDNSVPFGSPFMVIGTPFDPSTGAYATVGNNVNALFPVGTHSVSVQYSGDDNYAGSTSAAFTINVTDFGLSVTPSTINIPGPGKSGTAAVTVTPLGGFTGQMNVTCYVPNSLISCSVSPQFFNVTGASPATTTLTITTVGAPSLLTPAPWRMVPPSFRLPIGWQGLLVGILVLIALGSAIVPRFRPAVWSLSTALILAVLWTSCGGGPAGGGGGFLQVPAPYVNLSPTSLSFTQQVIGSTIANQSVLLANTGNAVLSISNIAVGGVNSGDFAQTNNCGSSVAAGGNCTIGLSFTPSGSGARSASLTITDNASGSPHSVSLSGTGLQSSLTLSPASLTFASLTAGLTSAPQTVTISNTGSTAVSISYIGIAVYYFHQTNNCPATLSAGAGCTVNVTFAPGMTGQLTGALTVTSTGASIPQTVSLSGFGTTPSGSYNLRVLAGSSATHETGITVTVQ